MTIKNNISIEETVDFLNSLLEIDNDAINSLFSIRVGCNKKIADHHSVQVAALSDEYFIFGIIGILNGLFGIDEHGWGHISADCEGSKITKFRLLTDNDVDGYMSKS